jgi:hypothetical protein
LFHPLNDAEAMEFVQALHLVHFLSYSDELQADGALDLILTVVVEGFALLSSFVGDPDWVLYHSLEIAKQTTDFAAVNEAVDLTESVALFARFIGYGFFYFLVCAVLTRLVAIS